MSKTLLLKKKVFAAKFSILSNSALFIGKFLVGIMTGSVSIIAEAIHSSIDLIAAIIANYSVKTSIKPPDEKHKFGHGKVENISALIEGILIFFAAYLILHESYIKFIGILNKETYIKELGIGIAIMLFSTIVNILVSYYLFKVAKETDSAALHADAWHLRTDVYTSVGVFAGLLTIKLTGIEIFDPIIAALTAFLIIKAGYDISKDAIFNLSDIRLSSHEEEIIKKAIKENSEKFVEFHKLRTRRAGSFKYIDLHLVVSKDLNIDKAHKLTHHLMQDIKKNMPNTDIMIHLEPCNAECEECGIPCPTHK